MSGFQMLEEERRRLRTSARPSGPARQAGAGSAARGGAAFGRGRRSSESAWASAGVGAKCRLGSGTNGATKARVIRREKSPACGPDHLGHAAEERGNPDGQPTAEPAESDDQPTAEPAIRVRKNGRSSSSYRRRKNRRSFQSRKASAQPLSRRPAG
jgi:hypothetical protein